MAVALEGFSIRGYTAQMRSVDFRKCWPFKGDSKGGEIAPSLPPISVHRSHWWLDELEAERLRQSDPDLENITSCCDELIAKNPGKGKQRVPKKRSIVELFDVAPQIETINGDEGAPGIGEVGAEEQEGEYNSPESGDRGDRAAVSISGAVSDKSKTAKKIKKFVATKMSNRKKKWPKMEICAKKEEKIRKPKVSCEIRISHSLKSPSSKRFMKKRLPLDAQNKKPRTMKILPKKQSFKVSRSSKLLSKDKESAKVFPARSILKNQKIAGSTKKTISEGERQVTFSGKEDIVRHKKTCSPNDLPQLQSLCEISSNLLAASSTINVSSNSNNFPPATERNRLLKVSLNADAEVVAESSISCLSDKKQLVEGQCRAAFSNDISKRNCPVTERAIIAGTLDLNCVMQSSDISDCLEPGDSTLLPNYTHSGSLQTRNSTYVKGLTSNTGFQSDENNAGFQAESLMMTSKVKSLPVLINVSRSVLTSIATTARDWVTHPPTSSCLITGMQSNDCGPHLSMEIKTNTLWQNPRNQSRNNIAGLTKDAELRPSDSSSICRDELIADSLTGLPLSSEDELIKSYSFDMSGLDDPFKNKIELLTSASSYPVLNLADSTTRVVQTRLNERLQNIRDNQLIRLQVPATVPVKSNVDIREMQNIRQIEVRSSDYVRNHDPSLGEPIRLRSCGCRECAQSKNFLAGRNMDQQTPPAIKTTMRLMGKDVTVGENNKAYETSDDGKTWTDKKIIAPHNVPLLKRDQVAQNHLQQFEARSSLYQIPIRDPLFGRMTFDCTPQLTSSSGLFSSVRNQGPKENKLCHPLPPVPKRIQNPDNSKVAKPMSSPASSDLPQWLLNAKIEKDQRTSCPSATDPYPVDARHSYTVEGNNLLHVTSRHRTPIIPPLSAYPSFIPSSPERKSAHAINPVSVDERKIGRESNFNYFKLLDRSDTTRKRVLGGGDDFIRQPKKPAYENSTAPSASRPVEQFFGGMSCASTENVETPAYGNKAMDAVTMTLNNEKYGFRQAPQSSSLELGGRPKLGPVKLSAGAKHILKPNQCVDKDNVMPVQSTIPSTIGTSSGIVSATQEKATKIYRF